MTLGFESYSFGRALSRKRIVVSNNAEDSSVQIESDPVIAPLKRMCSDKFTFNCERSRLEALPQDLLVSINFNFKSFQY